MHQDSCCSERETDKKIAAAEQRLLERVAKAWRGAAAEYAHPGSLVCPAMTLAADRLTEPPKEQASEKLTITGEALEAAAFVLRDQMSDTRNRFSDSWKRDLAACVDMLEKQARGISLDIDVVLKKEGAA